MASVRLLLNNTPRERTMVLIPGSIHKNTFASTSTTLASFLKYRPLRQPQFNRTASTASSQASSLPTSRSLHSSTTTRQAGTATIDHPDTGLLQNKPVPQSPPPSPREIAANSPLSILPLPTILRSLAVTTLSSSPLLLPPSLAITNILAHTNKRFLSPDHNPLLRRIIKSTFYAQFCAGENAAEVHHTMAQLKGLGFSGVILGFAREVVLTEEQTKELTACGLAEGAMEECIKSEVMPWADGTLETVRLAEEGDYVALKFTGAGRQALYTLSKRLAPPKALADAIDDICTLAAERGVRLLFDAEQQAIQPGIDDWTLHYMRKHNKAGKAVIHGTYQAYLKATPSVLASHMRAAQQEGFTLGVKLVRGAYLGSDPRHLIHDTKADTDACYNGIAEALLRRQYIGPLSPFNPSSSSSSSVSFPKVNMVLASHNIETVRKMRAILESATSSGGKIETEISFAQLQGMADEVSCEILAARAQEVLQPRALKYLVWGSTGTCMKYLLRRAHENQEALARTKIGRDAMRGEVWRRIKASVGLA